MIYLASQIGVWLLVAFAFGLVIGWFLWGRWVGIDLNRDFGRPSSGKESPSGSISVLSDSLLKTQRELEQCQQSLAETEARLGDPEFRFSSDMPDLGGDTFSDNTIPAYIPSNGEGSRDDLKKIHGIGPVIERKLAQLDITTYKQLALLSKEELDIVSDHINFYPGRIERDGWLESARDLYRDKYGEDI